MIFYLPLEPYKERYTELLTKWTTDRLDARGVSYEVISGSHLGSAIVRGSVLDAHGRSYCGLTQMSALVARLREGVPQGSVIYLDDMFTPGYEALPYIRYLTNPGISIVGRNHAQSVDPDDFTFHMRWMRDYERMFYRTADAVICASTVHREMMEIADLPRASGVRVLGLPFDVHDVRKRAGDRHDLAHAMRLPRVIYSSRLDAEKQPHFFLDVVEMMHKAKADAEVLICTGAQHVRSNDLTVVSRVESMEAAGMLRVVRGATKTQYYQLLADSRVQINTARQDFISYTAIEASALGVPTLAPAFRSFPEALEDKHEQLFVPWSKQDCFDKLMWLINASDEEVLALRVGSLAEKQHQTLDRIIDVLVEQGDRCR